MRSSKALNVTTVDWIERAAIAGSLACMVHCVVLPVVIASVPVLASILSLPESFHLWALAVAAPLALVALWQGRASHGRDRPLLIGVVGLALLLAGAVPLGNTIAEVPVIMAGGSLLVVAHLLNWRLRRRRACRGAAVR